MAKNPHYYKSEPLIAAVLRHNQYFDPELSLVAETAGKIVGHALFSPFEFVVLGERRKGVFLAPLSVDTNAQRQGIGSQLMAAGHRVAVEKGYAMSLLCGHPDYYPRFGYMNNAFAVSGATVDMSSLPAGMENVSERPVMEFDLPWIVDRWQSVHKNDRLAWFPGEKISQWFNHSLVYRSSVISQGSTRIAYVKYRKDNPARINELLAEQGAAQTALSYLRQEYLPEGKGEFLFSMSEAVLRGMWSDRQQTGIGRRIRTSDALFLKILDMKDELISRYCAEAKVDERNLGVLAFPTLMDIDN